MPRSLRFGTFMSKARDAARSRDKIALCGATTGAASSSHSTGWRGMNDRMQDLTSGAPKGKEKAKQRKKTPEDLYTETKEARRLSGDCTPIHFLYHPPATKYIRDVWLEYDKGWQGGPSLKELEREKKKL